MTSRLEDGGPARAGLLARRLALLALFEAEFRPGAAPAALDRLAVEREVPDEVRAHAAGIVAGVDEHRSELDARIAAEAPLIPGSRARSGGAYDPPERALRGAILRRDPERGADA